MNPRIGFPIHPRMLERLTQSEFYESRMAIQENVSAVDSFGSLADVWSDRAGLEDLACAVGPASGDEAKLPDGTYATNMFRAMIASHHPEIQPANRAVVDGVAYDILDVDTDSHAVATGLSLRKVT